MSPASVRAVESTCSRSALSVGLASSDENELKKLVMSLPISPAVELCRAGIRRETAPAPNLAPPAASWKPKPPAAAAGAAPPAPGRAPRSPQSRVTPVPIADPVDLDRRSPASSAPAACTPGCSRWPHCWQQCSARTDRLERARNQIECRVNGRHVALLTKRAAVVYSSRTIFKPAARLARSRRITFRLDRVASSTRAKIAIFSIGLTSTPDSTKPACRISVRSIDRRYQRLHESAISSSRSASQMREGIAMLRSPACSSTRAAESRLHHRDLYRSRSHAYPHQLLEPRPSPEHRVHHLAATAEAGTL